MKRIIQDTLSVLNSKERKQIGRVVLFNVIISIADIAALALLLVIIHAYTQANNISGATFLPYWLLNIHFLAPIFVFLLLFTLKNIVGYFVVKAQYNFVFQIATRLARSGMMHYLNIPYTDHVKTDSSVSIRQINHQPIEFSSYILSGIMQMITEAILTTLAIIAIVLFNVKLFLLLLIILLPPIIVAAYLTKRKLKAVRNNVRSTSEKTTQYLYEALNSYVESNVYHKKTFFSDRYIHFQKQLNKDLAQLQIAQAIPSRFIEVFAILGLFLLIVVNKYGANTTASELINIGAFMAAAYKIIPGITKMANLNAQIHMYSFTLKDLIKEQDHRPDTFNDSKERIRSIDLDKVSFSHTGQNILNQFSMTIKQGDLVGISSPSGKGKTTMINLLLGFLKTESGKISINDVPTDDELRKQYWHDIAYVKQQPFLIHDSIKHNITLSDETIDEPRLHQVIAVAGLSTFLRSFPEEIDKMITDNGKNISGGQRQRIAIARALYKNANFIILDEPFSELDSVSEEGLLKYFRSLAQQGGMVLLITHNKNSLSYCNKIISI